MISPQFIYSEAGTLFGHRLSAVAACEHHWMQCLIPRAVRRTCSKETCACYVCFFNILQCTDFHAAVERFIYQVVTRPTSGQSAFSNFALVIFQLWNAVWVRRILKTLRAQKIRKRTWLCPGCLFTCAHGTCALEVLRLSFSDILFKSFKLLLWIENWKAFAHFNLFSARSPFESGSHDLKRTQHPKRCVPHGPQWSACAEGACLEA